jgi:hypothetical protein
MKLREFAQVTLFVLFVAVSATLAQVPESPKTQKPEAAPVLTEFEKANFTIAGLKHRIATLQADLDVCQAKLAPATVKEATTATQSEVTKLILEFEKAHPGWTLDIQTMTAKKKE